MRQLQTSKSWGTKAQEWEKTALFSVRGLGSGAGRGRGSLGSRRCLTQLPREARACQGEDDGLPVP